MRYGMAPLSQVSHLAEGTNSAAHQQQSVVLYSLVMDQVASYVSLDVPEFPNFHSPVS